MLLAGLTVLMVLIGNALGGRGGMQIALIFAVAMNFFSYWYSDKIVLRMSGAQEVSESDAPELHRIVEELSRAGRHQLHIDVDRIPLIPLTETICRMLDLDPLGLIGSGSLIICCEESIQEEVIRSLQKEKIEASAIGRVLQKGYGIEAYRNGIREEWPSFETDELTRLFE